MIVGMLFVSLCWEVDVWVMRLVGMLIVEDEAIKLIGDGGCCEMKIFMQPQPHLVLCLS